MRVVLFLTLAICLIRPCGAAPAFAQFGDIRYPPGFSHFDYVNANAPKGGELVLVPNSRQSNFDRFNPFILKGEHPPGLAFEGKEGSLVLETLMTGSMDEPATMYGLLADDVQLAADNRSVVFHLNPLARFSNGDAVLAIDVKDSFYRQTSAQASPRTQILWQDIQGVQVLDPLRVRFVFKRADRNLVMAAASLPVFSHKWGAGKPFDQVVTDIPIGSGPYRIGHVNFGKDISYDRDPHYWARDLPVRRGQFNFDRITYKIYTDDTVRLEAFKAGEFDLLQENIARRWARQYDGKRFASGEVVKQEFPDPNPGFYQGYVFNLRRPWFQDVRVREAFQLALDFDWMNRQLFYNSYKQFSGYFPTPELSAVGSPGPDEQALLQTLEKQFPGKLPAGVMGPVPTQPGTNPPNSLRANLLRAQRLLAAAGWTYRDGALRNSAGQAFVVEFLYDQPSLVRILTPYKLALQKLGIDLRLRVGDAALVKKRLDVFDFDMTSIALGSAALPGADLKDLFASKSARTPGNLNYWGLQDPVVDALLDRVVAATTRAQLATTVRVLDRILAFGHYSVHNWYSPNQRLAYNAHKLRRPETPPPYYGAQTWAVETWWAADPQAITSVH